MEKDHAVFQLFFFARFSILDFKIERNQQALQSTFQIQKAPNANLNTSDPISEQELVSHSLNGNRQAQYALYRKYVGAMFHTVVRMVGSQEDAEDLTQEVFAKVFQQLHSFRGESTLGAWIKRIAVNTSLNFLRQANRIRFVDLANQAIQEDEATIDETAWAHDIRRIHEAIKCLPDGCRTVFTLYLLEGYPHREVAEMLGITESTSKTQYKRAKRLIRQELVIGCE